ncbi:UPF0619 GPI-anchored membrane protein [Penicillium mononematosum]|uniref:UPF0619 GPI-anchored membrane protein n=1 Tax=Penicillium mononematosum TaxID=268346 RepID=UPI0025468D96|nr:UPF0619 GPI-anchored membrane protein [Penicillium mononematosum]KAJ6188481.1 UPF0619 GPI-anchored membrane protein [Penicillium mononematosum]
MRINIISLVALAATAAGLTVTSPRMGEKIDPDMPLTIKWQAVSTDPETFSIELVNQNVYPPTTTIVAQDIDSSKGSYTVNAKTFTDVDDGKGYQINFLSPTSGILAQSQQFKCVYPYLVLLFYCFIFYFYPYNIFFYKLVCNNFILYYIHLCYPDYFFFHYRVFYLTYYIHPSFYLDFHIKHYFLYHVSFYPHIHYPWLVKAGFRDSILLFTHYIKETETNYIHRIDLSFNDFIDQHVYRNPFEHYFDHHSQVDFNYNLQCHGVCQYNYKRCCHPHAPCW